MKVQNPEYQIRRVRHQLVKRDVEVARIEILSPGIRAITFGGNSLADFVSASFDDHVKFMFTDEEGELVRRDYTPRIYDPLSCELTLEFSLHDGGRASRWARQALPGMKAVIAGPRGSMIIPSNYDWHLLAGDASALPAISRRMEELPTGSTVIAIVQLDDPSDRRTFQSQAVQHVSWIYTTEEFISWVKNFEAPSDDGFVWCAGEGSTMSRLRPILVEEKGFRSESMRVAAYWKKGLADFHESLVNPTETAPTVT